MLDQKTTVNTSEFDAKTTVTINGKTTWRVYGFAENGDLRIYRYVDTEQSRRRINRVIVASKVKVVA